MVWLIGNFREAMVAKERRKSKDASNPSTSGRALPTIIRELTADEEALLNDSLAFDEADLGTIKPAGETAVFLTPEPAEVPTEVASHQAAGQTSIFLPPEPEDEFAWVGTKPTRKSSPLARQETPPPATIPRQPPAGPPKPTPKRRARGDVIASVIGVIIVATAIVLTVLVWLPLSRDKSQFDDAVAELLMAQTALGDQAKLAESFLATVDINRVDDSLAVDDLSRQLAEAKDTATTAVPSMASGSTAIRQQITEITALTDSIRLQTGNLMRAVHAVKNTQLSWAATTLSIAIDGAQSVYDQYKNFGHKSSLAALKAKIVEVRNLLLAIADGDPAQVGDIAKQAAEELQIVQMTVIEKSPARCDNGIVLPKGVDAMVCGGMPEKAITVNSPKVYPSTMFQTPSGNIGCFTENRVQDSPVICEIIRAVWDAPGPLMSQCRKESEPWEFGSYCNNHLVGINSPGRVFIVAQSDIPPFGWAQTQSKPIFALQYGQVAMFNGVACLSALDGVTCWSTTTHHGFKINSEKFRYW